jgi:hypothetical protein
LFRIGAASFGSEAPPDREQLPLAKVPDLWAELKQARVTVTFDATNQKITPSRVTLTFDARRP